MDMAMECRLKSGSDQRPGDHWDGSFRHQGRGQRTAAWTEIEYRGKELLIRLQEKKEQDLVLD